VPASKRTTTDGRTLLKQRHRRAILDAAAALMEETGGTDFGVDRLAERAEVSRRTVFNHFASIDDIVIEVTGEILSGLIDRFQLGEPRESLYDEVADAIRGTDLVEPMAYLTRVLGGDEPVDAATEPAHAVILSRASSQVSERLVSQILDRRPDTDELTVRLLAGALMSGLVELNRRWHAETGASVDDASRAAWSRLLEHLLDTTRRGYGSL
jgi:TetR/AcrR family transcriptional regulator, regulator of autoinduction and epiphytic fitness